MKKNNLLLLTVLGITLTILAANQYADIGMQNITLTAEDQGRWYVLKNDTIDGSYHLTEREAVEHALRIKQQFPDAYVSYEPDYKVSVESETHRVVDNAYSVWGGYSPSLLFRDPSITASYIDSIATTDIQLTSYSEADSIQVLSRCIGTDTLYKHSFDFAPQQDSLYLHIRETCNQVSVYYLELFAGQDSTTASYFIDIWALRNNYN